MKQLGDKKTSIGKSKIKIYSTVSVYHSPINWFFFDSDVLILSLDNDIILFNLESDVCLFSLDVHRKRTHSLLVIRVMAATRITLQKVLHAYGHSEYRVGQKPFYALHTHMTSLLYFDHMAGEMTVSTKTFSTNFTLKGFSPV